MAADGVKHGGEGGGRGLWQVYKKTSARALEVSGWKPQTLPVPLKLLQNQEVTRLHVITYLFISDIFRKQHIQILRRLPKAVHNTMSTFLSPRAHHRNFSFPCPPLASLVDLLPLHTQTHLESLQQMWQDARWLPCWFLGSAIKIKVQMESLGSNLAG